MIKTNLKCPYCNGNLKVDVTRHIITETFVLAPPIEPVIMILFCEKCGKVIRTNPADMKLKNKSNDLLCIHCIYAVKFKDKIKCLKFEAILGRKEKVVECVYFKEKN